MGTGKCPKLQLTSAKCRAPLSSSSISEETTPSCLTNQQESEKGSACDHPQTNDQPKTKFILLDNVLTAPCIQYHQHATIGSNHAPVDDLNTELRKWLKEHNLDTHDRFLLKHDIRSLTELRAAAESSSLENLSRQVTEMAETCLCAHFAVSSMTRRKGWRA
jgi:hypothetical protein